MVTKKFEKSELKKLNKLLTQRDRNNLATRHNIKLKTIYSILNGTRNNQLVMMDALEIASGNAMKIEEARKFLMEQ